MLNKIFKPSVVLFAIFSLSQAYAADDSASKNNLLERVEDLENQITLLEERLPKRIRKLPLDLPHLTTNGAVQESYSRVEQMFNINFIQYHHQVRQNRRYCTEQAFDSYLNFLKKTGWVNKLVETKSLMYVFPNGSPKVLKEGARNKRYAWMVEMPLKVSIENNAERKDYPILATVTIERASELNHPKGMLISEMTFKQSS